MAVPSCSALSNVSERRSASAAAPQGFVIRTSLSTGTLPGHTVCSTMSRASLALCYKHSFDVVLVARLHASFCADTDLVQSLVGDFRTFLSAGGIPTHPARTALVEKKKVIIVAQLVQNMDIFQVCLGEVLILPSREDTLASINTQVTGALWSIATKSGTVLVECETLEKDDEDVHVACDRLSISANKLCSAYHAEHVVLARFDIHLGADAHLKPWRDRILLSGCRRQLILSPPWYLVCSESFAPFAGYTKSYEQLPCAPPSPELSPVEKAALVFTDIIQGILSATEQVKISSFAALDTLQPRRQFWAEGVGVTGGNTEAAVLAALVGTQRAPPDLQVSLTLLDGIMSHSATSPFDVAAHLPCLKPTGYDSGKSFEEASTIDKAVTQKSYLDDTTLNSMVSCGPTVHRRGLRPTASRLKRNLPAAGQARQVEVADARNAASSPTEYGTDSHEDDDCIEDVGSESEWNASDVSSDGLHEEATRTQQHLAWQIKLNYCSLNGEPIRGVLPTAKYNVEMTQADSMQYQHFKESLWAKESKSGIRQVSKKLDLPAKAAKTPTLHKLLLQFEGAGIQQMADVILQSSSFQANLTRAGQLVFERAALSTDFPMGRILNSQVKVPVALRNKTGSVAVSFLEVWGKRAAIRAKIMHDFASAWAALSLHPSVQLAYHTVWLQELQRLYKGDRADLKVQQDIEALFTCLWLWQLQVGRIPPNSPEPHREKISDIGPFFCPAHPFLLQLLACNRHQSKPYGSLFYKDPTSGLLRHAQQFAVDEFNEAVANFMSTSPSQRDHAVNTISRKALAHFPGSSSRPEILDSSLPIFCSKLAPSRIVVPADISKMAHSEIMRCLTDEHDARAVLEAGSSSGAAAVGGSGSSAAAASSHAQGVLPDLYHFDGDEAFEADTQSSEGGAASSDSDIDEATPPPAVGGSGSSAAAASSHAQGVLPGARRRKATTTRKPDLNGEEAFEADTQSSDSDVATSPLSAGRAAAASACRKPHSMASTTARIKTALEQACKLVSAAKHRSKRSAKVAKPSRAPRRARDTASAADTMAEDSDGDGNLLCPPKRRRQV